MNINREFKKSHIYHVQSEIFVVDVNGIFNQMDKEIKKNAKDFGCNIRHRDDCIERLRSNHEVKECCDCGRQYRAICQIL